MTPREKAMELIDKYLCVEDEYRGDNGCGITPYEAKQCALIAVDEAIEYEKRIIKEVQFLSDICGHAFRCEGLYWQEVKYEIEKL